MIRILRRIDGNAEPEIDQLDSNCANGLQHFAYLAQNSNVTQNHMSSGLDFDFGNNEFTYGVDGSEKTSPFGEGMRARRNSRMKMRKAKQDSKIRLRDAKAKSKVMKAGAKQTRADSKVISAKGQNEMGKALANQKDVAVNLPPIDAPAESTGMNPKTKKILIYGGIGLAVIGIGTFVYFKFIKKK